MALFKVVKFDNDVDDVNADEATIADGHLTLILNWALVSAYAPRAWKECHEVTQCDEKSETTD